jgi:photosystem II oxygen-evolving enhancer protein 3
MQLEEASRNKNLLETQACYKETEVMLKDVMDRMTIMYKTI